MSTYSVIDIFAGPGGLAEGFSSVRSPDGNRAFKIALSIEKDAAAHSTLRLRAFLRQFEGGYPAEYYDFLNNGSAEPDWSELYPVQWYAAEQEAWLLELGNEDPEFRLNARLDAIRRENDDKTILIGGPPCQAYSLAGRSRNVGKEGYVASEDSRHFLYQEYIRILHRLKPAAFVMENVKGMLSSSVDGQNKIFDKVLDDLRGNWEDGTSYRLIALSPDLTRQKDLLGAEPRSDDFIITAESYGVPQARHRVIIVGLRHDIADGLAAEFLSDRMAQHLGAATVGDVLGGMPCLRSGLSRGDDSGAEWQRLMVDAMGFVADVETDLSDEDQAAFAARARECQAIMKAMAIVPTRDARGIGISETCPAHLREWLLDDRLRTLPNHASRSHMTSDLVRYFFAAVYAEVVGRSPKASDFPAELAPDHQNWTSGKFTDRFRVQLAGSASTTVTSHISKDGHYFIHPDPLQCRSLSVREAARLQTFPDNYFFKGNRTQQYVQVGNAVPPYLAKLIGDVLLTIIDERLGAVSPNQSIEYCDVA